MVPLYQLALHLAVATVLLFAAIYTPFIFNRRLPRWLEMGMGAIALVLVGGVVYGLLAGHWPLRG